MGVAHKVVRRKQGSVDARHLGVHGHVAFGQGARRQYRVMVVGLGGHVVRDFPCSEPSFVVTGLAPGRYRLELVFGRLVLAKHIDVREGAPVRADFFVHPAAQS